MGKASNKNLRENNSKNSKKRKSKTFKDDTYEKRSDRLKETINKRVKNPDKKFKYRDNQSEYALFINGRRMKSDYMLDIDI